MKKHASYATPFARVRHVTLGLLLLVAFLTPTSAQAQRELVFAQASPHLTFDPHNHNALTIESVLAHVMDYLIMRNAEGAMEPGLATSWENVGPTAWRFMLREGVSFHDGVEFTAEDVKFSLERVAKDDTLYWHENMRTIERVEIVGDHEIIIHTVAPDPILLNRLTTVGSLIVPKHYVESVGWGEFSENPLGSGPYRYESWIRDDRVTLLAFDEHWRGRPAYDRLVMRSIPEASTRVAELLAGGVDIAVLVPTQDVERINASGMAKIVSQPTVRVMLFQFNTAQDAVTGDQRVRAAIDYAIDTQLIIDTLFDGAGTPARARIARGISGAPAELYDTYVYDPERARELLAEAGYGPGELTIKLQGPVNQYPNDGDILEVVAIMLREVGINAEVETYEWSAFLDRVWADNVDHMAMVGFGNPTFDGHFSLRAHVCEGSYTPRTHWCNEEFTELVNSASSEVNIESREAMLAEAFNILVEERVEIGLFQLVNSMAIGNGVEWTARADELFWLYEAQPVD